MLAIRYHHAIVALVLTQITIKMKPGKPPLIPPATDDD